MILKDKMINSNKNMIEEIQANVIEQLDNMESLKATKQEVDIERKRI